MKNMAMQFGTQIARQQIQQYVPPQQYAQYQPQYGPPQPQYVPPQPQYAPPQPQYAPPQPQYAPPQPQYTPPQPQYAPRLQQQSKKTRVGNSLLPNGMEMEQIVGIILKITVIVLVPFSAYKAYTSLPFDILKVFENLFKLDFSAAGNEISKVLNLTEYKDTLIWLLVMVITATTFIGYCKYKELLLKDENAAISQVIKQVFPKLILYVVPVAGQGILVADIVKCFME
jgi:hypothetical protein